MSKKAAEKTAEKKAEGGVQVVARNRRARYEFDLIEKVEAGIVLTGTEVKSLRNGKSSLEEAYASLERDELWLYGCDIPEYLEANRMNHKPKRPRKLLLHRSEIDKIAARLNEKGMTLVPLQIYFKRGLAKVEVCLAKGRKTYDKRQAIKKNEAKREMDRVLKKNRY